MIMFDYILGVLPVQSQHLGQRFLILQIFRHYHVGQSNRKNNKYKPEGKEREWTRPKFVARATPNEFQNCPNLLNLKLLQSSYTTCTQNKRSNRAYNFYCDPEIERSKNLNLIFCQSNHFFVFKRAVHDSLHMSSQRSSANILRSRYAKNCILWVPDQKSKLCRMVN